MLEQRISFVRTRDRVRLACAESGRGPPLLRAGTWLTHLDFDWNSPVWGHWWRFLSSRHRLIRYDERGCGLSDRDPASHTFDDWVGDLEAVADGLGLERFPLLGMSQGAAVAIAYAVRHPERVSRLLLYGGMAAGWRYGERALEERWRSIRDLVRVGWGDDNAAFRAMFGHLFVPEARPEHISWYADLAQRSAGTAITAAIIDVFGSMSVSAQLHDVTVPTLVIHAERDAVVPFAAGRAMAEGIPGARFASLDTCNHLLLEAEPAWHRFCALFDDFVGTEPSAPAGPRSDFSSLTARERDVLARLAQGLSNGQIAESLYISEKTVRNHVSNILDKLGVDSRARAIVLAKDGGFRP